MDVLERFKRMTECTEDEAFVFQEPCLALKEHIAQVEYHCRKMRDCLDEMLDEQDDEIGYDDALFLSETELPVEDYKLIREKYGEEAANRMYYDVKLGKVPLQFVQRYLCKIREK